MNRNQQSLLSTDTLFADNCDEIKTKLAKDESRSSICSSNYILLSTPTDSVFDDNCDFSLEKDTET